MEWETAGSMEDVEEMGIVEEEDELAEETWEILERLELVDYPITLQMQQWLAQGYLLEIFQPMMLDLPKNYWKKLSINMGTF